MASATRDVQNAVRSETINLRKNSDANSFLNWLFCFYRLMRCRRVRTHHMNKVQEEEFRQQRVRQAETIKAESHFYKVCQVCTSVGRKNISICSVCHAYRWDESPAAVEAADEGAARFVFPATLGYAPTSTRQPECPSPPGWYQIYRTQ